MKPSEIWRVPIDDTQDALLRVVLNVGDLGLEPTHPMAFVEGCFLVQVARPGVESFDRASLLVDGLFLAHKARDAKRAGLKSVGHAPVSLSDVEFPWWMIDDSRRGVLFCRGEIVSPVTASSAKDVYARWDVRLSPKYPAQLAGSLRQLLGLLDGTLAASAHPQRLLGIPGSDIRYHPNREVILREAGVDVTEPYARQLARVEPKRVDVYRKAIAGAVNE